LYVCIYTYMYIHIFLFPFLCIMYQHIAFTYRGIQGILGV
jgi:hypothetical protein